MAPPPAITPTGEESEGAADVMLAAIPCSIGAGGKTERPQLAALDEGEDFRDRGILARQRLHRSQPLGEDAGAVEQLLIERTHGCEPRLGELAAAHADDVEAFEHCVLAVGAVAYTHKT